MPCSIPVGTALKPASSARRVTSFGNGCRGEIDLRDRQAHQRVAHGAADDARLFTVAIERIEHFRDVPLAEQMLERGARPCVDAGRRHGFAAGASKPPGTRRPFSRCAGR